MNNPQQQINIAVLPGLVWTGLRLVVGGLALSIAILALLDLAIDLPRFKMSAQSFAYWMAGAGAILWGTRG